MRRDVSGVLLLSSSSLAAAPTTADSSPLPSATREGAYARLQMMHIQQQQAWAYKTFDEDSPFSMYQIPTQKGV